MFDYEPDYLVHPGEILEEHLSCRSMTKTELARRSGLSVKHISQIINCKASISPETAILFEKVLDVAADIWTNLQTLYDLRLARQNERRRLAADSEWARDFPIAALVKRGHIAQTRDVADRVASLLRFFGVPRVEIWEEQYKDKRLAVSYRQSSAFRSSKESVAAWLRVGELMAENISTQRYDRGSFRESLRQIRTLTRENPDVFEPRMRELCQASGVALIFVSELPKTRLFGATRWLTSDKVLIMQSLRRKSDDYFWFTFFHEAGHILLHGKKDVYIDEKDMGTNEKEEEANRFASNALIPEATYRAFLRRKRFYKEDVIAFAEQMEIAPGIVVGRLQHGGHIPHSWHNDLKRTFELTESSKAEANHAEYPEGA